MQQPSDLHVAPFAREILRLDDYGALASIRAQAEEMAEAAVFRGEDIRAVCVFMSQVNDALTSHIVTLAIQTAALPEGLAPSFCWLSLGSEGRGEQVLRTDQDNAIVFAEPDDDQRDAALEYYLKIGKEATVGLHRCGFEYCPGDTMASNPVWCRPLSSWIRSFHQWMSVPREDALMNAAICFDFRPVSGDVSLGAKLRRVIDQELRFERTALVLMAKNVIRTPDALGFWGRCILERKGAETGLFDLKLRAMKPLVDAARVLALELGLHATTNTIDRFRAVAERNDGLRPICTRAGEAFAFILRLRAENGLRRKDNGRFVATRVMAPAEMDKLMGALHVLRDLQTLVRVRYQLDSLGLS